MRLEQLGESPALPPEENYEEEDDPDDGDYEDQSSHAEDAPADTRILPKRDHPPLQQVHHRQKESKSDYNLDACDLKLLKYASSGWFLQFSTNSRDGKGTRRLALDVWTDFRYTKRQPIWNMMMARVKKELDGTDAQSEVKGLWTSLYQSLETRLQLWEKRHHRRSGSLAHLREHYTRQDGPSRGISPTRTAQKHASRRTSACGSEVHVPVSAHIYRREGGPSNASQERRSANGINDEPSNKRRKIHKKSRDFQTQTDPARYTHLQQFYDQSEPSVSLDQVNDPENFLGDHQTSKRTLLLLLDLKHQQICSLQTEITNTQQLPTLLTQITDLQTQVAKSATTIQSLHAAARDREAEHRVVFGELQGRLKKADSFREVLSGDYVLAKEEISGLKFMNRRLEEVNKELREQREGGGASG
ncbi:hypothetical protein HDV00_006381 [Rhizophlyctis rosea]|nr:hypothetical protein HDV00_006381 [Rhizophlyctis rosea]